MNKKSAYIRLCCFPEFVPVLVCVCLLLLNFFLGFSFSCVEVLSNFFVGFEEVFLFFLV